MLAPQSLGFTPKSISFSVLKDLPSWMVASADRAAHRAGADGARAVRPWRPRRARHVRDRRSRPENRDRQHRRARPQAHRGRVPLRRQGLLHPLRQLHLPAGDRHPVRRGFRDLRQLDTEFIQTVYAQRDAIFRGGEIAWQWDLVPVATGIFGVDGQYDFVRATFTDGSNVPRMPPMRLGGGTYWRNDNWFVRMGLLHAFGQSDLGAERHADRRLQPAQDGDQQQAVLADIRRGDRPRSPPASSATTCSTSTCATPCSSTRTKSCCPGAASSSS